ncbi:MAG: hypothetical protein H0V60_03665, partial [Actinobacteria bacterium]|nr:hypothetical protein [Actinomycetota bacterium]
WDKDIERRNAIEAEGWRVLNVTKAQMDDNNGKAITGIIRRILRGPTVNPTKGVRVG